MAPAGRICQADLKMSGTDIAGMVKTVVLVSLAVALAIPLTGTGELATFERFFSWLFAGDLVPGGSALAVVEACAHSRSGLVGIGSIVLLLAVSQGFGRCASSIWAVSCCSTEVVRLVGRLESDRPPCRWLLQASLQ